MTHKKGQMAAIIGSVVMLIVGIVLLVGVLVPVTSTTITQAGNTTAYLNQATYNTTSYYQTSFSGVQKTITDNLITFILIGTLVLIAAGAFLMKQ